MRAASAGAIAAAGKGDTTMKRTLAVLTIAAALGLGLSACETATLYQPRIAGAHIGGYSEERIDASHWRVHFSGNSVTSRETVEKYLLYRAAELTIQQGGDWFEATDTNTERRTRYYLERDPFYDSAYGMEYGWGWRPYWRYYRPFLGWRTWDPLRNDRFWTDSYELREISRYVATVEIAIGKGPKPEGRRVLDARDVLANLGPSVIRPGG